MWLFQKSFKEFTSFVPHSLSTRFSYFYSVLFYNNFIYFYIWYGTYLYYSLSTATKLLYNLQKQVLGQPFQICESYKILSTAWVARKTNILPLPPLSSYFACAMLSKQDNAHLTLQITLCHLPLKPHTTNMNELQFSLQQANHYLVKKLPFTAYLFTPVTHFNLNSTFSQPFESR